jgi:hypothetical protein
MPRRGRPCSVCTSPHATSVALDVTRGETLSTIAKRYGFSLMAVSRHRTNCLGVDEGEARQVAKAVNRRIIEAALPTRENLVGRLEDVSQHVDQLASETEGMGPSAISLGALAELRRTVESLAKVAGITDRADVKVGVQVNTAGPSSDQVAHRLLECLNGNPEARAALAAALMAECEPGEAA